MDNTNPSIPNGTDNMIHTKKNVKVKMASYLVNIAQPSVSVVFSLGYYQHISVSSLQHFTLQQNNHLRNSGVTAQDNNTRRSSSCQWERFTAIDQCDNLTVARHENSSWKFLEINIHDNPRYTVYRGILLKFCTFLVVYLSTLLEYPNWQIV